MKNNKFFLFIVFILMFALMPANVRAEGKELLKKNEYITRNRQDKKNDFKEDILENGKKYHLKKVTYQMKEEAPVTTREPIAVTVTSKKVKKGEYKPKDSVEKDGVECKLQNTTEKEVVIKKSYIRTVTGYSVYESEEEAENAPATKEVTSKDVSGETLTVLCGKRGIKKLNASSWQNTHIDITFISYDADTFRWGGITVKKSEKQPLRGYEGQLLKSVGGNTKNYKVNSISWNGKAYRNADGVLCRKAVASVSKKIPHYQVNYKATQRVPAEMGIVYTSTYAGLKETVTGETDYTMVAIGHYEEAESKVPVAAITVGILLAVLLLVGILWIVRKKQGGTEKKVKGNRCHK